MLTTLSPLTFCTERRSSHNRHNIRCRSTPNVPPATASALSPGTFHRSVPRAPNGTNTPTTPPTTMCQNTQEDQGAQVTPAPAMDREFIHKFQGTSKPSNLALHLTPPYVISQRKTPIQHTHNTNTNKEPHTISHTMKLPRPYNKSKILPQFASATPTNISYCLSISYCITSSIHRNTHRHTSPALRYHPQPLTTITLSPQSPHTHNPHRHTKSLHPTPQAHAPKLRRLPTHNTVHTHITSSIQSYNNQCKILTKLRKHTQTHLKLSPRPRPISQTS